MPQPLLYLSAYLERNRERYMDLLLEVSKTGAWLEWITFFLEGVRQSAEESLSQADSILALRDDYHERMRGSRAFGQLQKLIDGLFRSPSTTIALTASHLTVSAATASGHIKRLVDAGVLREWTGRKRDQVFIAPGILQFMHGPDDSR
jgi:Fic family protein